MQFNSNLLPVVAAIVCAALACTKQQEVSAANGAVQLSVDQCKELEAPDSGASSLVRLGCQTLIADQGLVTVLVDAGVWASMKRGYLAQHGVLPMGMSAPTP